MAALLTPTSCLVLTGGVAPIEYVRYEAELERVPIMVVESDTLSTMDAVSALGDGARFDRPAKLDAFGGLLSRHVDLAPLYDGLGLGLA